jgi:hypothetical protein
MLDSLSQTLHIILGDGKVTLARSQGWPKRRVQRLDERSPAAGETGEANLLAMLDGMLEEARVDRAPVCVALADDQVRTWLVEPTATARSWLDCQAVIAMRFSVVYDEAPDDWQLSSVQCLDQPFLAFGVRRGLIGTLQAVLLKHRLALRSVQPESAMLWNYWHRSLGADAWFGICRGESLTLGLVHQRRLRALRPLVLSVADREDHGWLTQSMAREAARMCLPPPATLALCGQAPAEWLNGERGTRCVRLGSIASALALSGDLA